MMKIILFYLQCMWMPVKLVMIFRFSLEITLLTLHWLKEVGAFVFLNMNVGTKILPLQDARNTFMETATALSIRTIIKETITWRTRIKLLALEEKKEIVEFATALLNTRILVFRVGNQRFSSWSLEQKLRIVVITLVYGTQSLDLSQIRSKTISGLNFANFALCLSLLFTNKSKLSF